MTQLWIAVNPHRTSGSGNFGAFQGRHNAAGGKRALETDVRHTRTRTVGFPPQTERATHRGMALQVSRSESSAYFLFLQHRAAYPGSPARPLPKRATVPG